ncbi:MAG TPA: DinB family protein [Candidatus Angelobacter sp.]|nr:DinB family protein [Candidatus Angelobacter sp.]
MSEIARILDQYDRALHRDAWHGDPVWKILAGVNPRRAFRRLSPATHSIWELVMHMAFWETAVHRRLRKLPKQSVKKLNFPALPEPTAANWNYALGTLRASNVAFRETLAQLDETELDKPLSSARKSVYVEVHGVIQHHLYHAGQMAVLRKILMENTEVTRL